MPEVRFGGAIEERTMLREPAPGYSRDDAEKLADKAFVMTHQQLRFQLLHGVQHHTDDDKEAGAGDQE